VPVIADVGQKYMSDKRSLRAFDGARDGQSKFDYFVAGLTGAMFAYIVQTYTPKILSFTPDVLEPFSLLLLAVSFFLALKRIEASNLVQGCNYEHLDFAEKAGGMTEAMMKVTGVGYNVHSGEAIHPSDLPGKREVYMQMATEAEQASQLYARRAEVWYRYRNLFLLAGFSAIFLSKLLQPYA